MAYKFNPNYNNDDNGTETSSKFVMSKFDYDLYDEDQDITSQVIRVKRIGLPNKEERWRVYCDAKILFIVDGIKLLKKEKAFLRTPEGISFLIGMAKIKIKSFHQLHLQIKKILKKKK